MARLDSIGFELNSTSLEWTSTTGSPTIQTGTVRSGTYAGQVTSFFSASPKGFLYAFASTAGNGPYYFRFYINIATAPNVANEVFGLSNSSAFVIASEVGISLTTSRTLVLTDHGSQVGSESSALALNTWYMVELFVNRTTVAGAHVATARLEGTQFATRSTYTFTNAFQSFQLGGNFRQEGVTTGSWFFDDIAVNDTTGTSQTSYPGSGKIVHLHPASAGDNAQWAQGVGGTTNWGRVSEVTPDGATTYNKRAATGTLIDDHRVGSYPGLSTDTITLVQVGAYLGATSATATGRTGVLRIKGQSAGTVLSSAAFGWNVNGFVINSITTPTNYQLTAYTNPQTSTAWTPTTLGTMQIGYTNGTSSANQINISALWALVEYVPANVIQTFTTTHTTNSLLRVAVTKAHTTDSYKLRSPNLTHTADANLRGVFTKTQTTDSLERKANTLTHTTDSYLLRTLTVSHTTNSLLRKTFTQTQTTDALKRVATALTHTTSSFLYRTVTLFQATDSLKRAAHTLTHTADSYKHTEVAKTHTSDSYLSSALKTLTLDTNTDSLLRGTFTVFSGYYATLKVELQIYHTTDSLLRKAVSKTHTADSFIRREVSLTHTTNSLIRLGVPLSHTTDSFGRRELSLTHATDSLILRLSTFITTHTADSYKEAALFGDWSETWDGLVINYTQSSTSDSLLRKAVSLTHTTSSNLLYTATIIQTVDALLKHVKTVSHTTDASLAKTLLINHTTNAFIRATITKTHTTNSLLAKAYTLSHGTDSYIKDASQTVHHKTQSLLRFHKFVEPDKPQDTYIKVSDTPSTWSTTAKPTDTYTTGTKPTDSWTKLTNASDSWTPVVANDRPDDDADDY